MNAPEAPFVRHSIPSLEAALAIAPHLEPLEARLYALLAGVGAAGATDEELATWYAQYPDKRKDSTLRARRVSLCDKGLVRDSGQTRPGVSGRQMTVWVVAGAG